MTLRKEQLHAFKKKTNTIMLHADAMKVCANHLGGNGCALLLSEEVSTANLPGEKDCTILLSPRSLGFGLRTTAWEEVLHCKPAAKMCPGYVQSHLLGEKDCTMPCFFCLRRFALFLHEQRALAPSPTTSYEFDIVGQLATSSHNPLHGHDNNHCASNIGHMDTITIMS